MENSNFSTWITSLYVSLPSSVVFAYKTAHFGPEFEVSMGPSPHLLCLHAILRVLAQNYMSLWVPDLTCPFVQSKRRDLHQNIKSILVPALICGFERQVMSGTHRDLFFWSISRCCASKNHTWGLGPMDTSISAANHTVLNAQSKRCGLGSTETINSVANLSVLHAQNDRWSLGPIETCNSDPEDAVLPGKTSDEGWDPLRLAILVLKALFCMHTRTGEVWDPERLLILIIMTLLWMQKNSRWGLGPIETCNSGAKEAVLNAQKT